MTDTGPIVEIEHLTKTYAAGEQTFFALNDVSLTLARGDFAAIVGPSGSGKSTLMHIIGLLDRASSGLYRFEGQDIAALSANALADLRNRCLGFVFQAYNLLPRTSALDNVQLPMIYAGVPERERRLRAMETLEAVGVANVADHVASEMSGGQMQRVAIARALVNDPVLILADEPTGALDTKSSMDVMDLFAQLNRERSLTILIVTHEPHVAARTRRIVTLRDGRVVSDAPARAQEAPVLA